MVMIITLEQARTLAGTAHAGRALNLLVTAKAMQSQRLR